MRVGDKVEILTSLGRDIYGTEGTVTWVDGGYISVRHKNSKIVQEFYPEELLVTEEASDARYKAYLRQELERQLANLEKGRDKLTKEIYSLQKRIRQL